MKLSFLNKLYNNNKVVIILSFFILFLLLLFFIFFLSDLKNTRVQPHLSSIYNNIQELNKTYPTFLNKHPTITYENDVYIIQNVLRDNYYQYLKNQFKSKTFESKNVFVRKATGVSFFDLHGNHDYNGFLELYYSNELMEFLTNVLKKPIQKSPLHDPNACSLLIYSQKGDFIDWHKDLSLYYGDRYVVLLTLINENAEKMGLSQNEFVYKYQEREKRLQLPENSIIIFKGSEVFHKSTEISEGERRILLSMTYCDICQEKKNIFNFFYEKVKNLVLYQ